MKKKLLKWALTLTALSVLPLLQGCADEDDEDNFLIRNAWAPVGTTSAFGVPVTGGQGANGGGPGGQNGGGSGLGARIGSTGGGGQVSTGGVAL